MALENLRPVSHETIYRCIYHNKRSGGKLYLFIKHKKIRLAAVRPSEA